MRRKWIMSVVSAAISISLQAGQSKAVENPNATAVTPPGAPQFVRIAPCVMLDTIGKAAANAAEETLRHVNVKTNRCSPLIPGYATKYSLKVTSYSRTAPEKWSAATLPVVRAAEVVATVNGVLDFPVPADSHIAVVVDGYWVAPGTPIEPADSTSAASAPPGMHAESTAARIPGAPAPQIVHTGASDHGEIYLDGTGPAATNGVDYTSAGVAMLSPQSAFPHIKAILGDDNSHGPAWFSVYDTHPTPRPPAVSSCAFMGVVA